MFKTQAMAFERGHAESKITELGMPLLEHLDKVFVYPKSRWVEYWFNEIETFYNAITDYGNNLKKGKKFKASDYEKFLTIRFSNKEKLENTVRLIMRKEHQLHPRGFSFDVLVASLAVIYQVLAAAASKDEPFSKIKPYILSTLT